MTRRLSSKELHELTSQLEPSAKFLIAGWLDRGDGVAVYINHDLGHPEIGHAQFVSYGSPEAQIETGEPPETMPDFEGMAPNWRYRLHGAYRKEAP